MSEVTQFTPPHPLNTAVLFLVFNRLDTTKQVFEAIRQAKPPRLYVAADGARANKEGEAEKVQAVRDYIMQNIDWECEVKTLFREKNLGCKYAVSGAITWFFENEEQGIILEDDCLPSQSFFWYCEELLERYKNDERVWHIDGTNFTGNSVLFEASYDFSSYALIWGWASWARAWKSYDIQLSGLELMLKRGYLEWFLGSSLAAEYWKVEFVKVKNTEFDTWDYQWFYSIWKNNGLSIRPSVNMIKNVGFGSDATHTTKSNKMFEEMQRHEINIPLNIPELILKNPERDLLCSKIRFGIDLKKFIKIKLKKLFGYMF